MTFRCTVHAMSSWISSSTLQSGASAHILTRRLVQDSPRYCLELHDVVMVVEELARMLCIHAMMEISWREEHAVQDTNLVSRKSPGAADNYSHVEHDRDKLWLAMCTDIFGKLYMFSLHMYGLHI